jgi:hypothetical protein
MRCAEQHTVVSSGALPIQKHYDAGSLFTSPRSGSNPVDKLM